MDENLFIDDIEKEQESENIKAKAVVDIATNPMKMVSAKISQSVSKQINDDTKTSEKVDQAASRIIDKGIKDDLEKITALENRTAKEIRDTDFELNKDEYLHHGIDHKVPRWQSYIMIVMNSIWFVLLSVVFFFTFIPFSMFMSRVRSLKGILRFVAICVGIILLLVILFSITVWVLHITGTWSIFARSR